MRAADQCVSVQTNAMNGPTMTPTNRAATIDHATIRAHLGQIAASTVSAEPSATGDLYGFSGSGVADGAVITTL